MAVSQFVYTTRLYHIKGFVVCHAAATCCYVALSRCEQTATGESPEHVQAKGGGGKSPEYVVSEDANFRGNLRGGRISCIRLSGGYNYESTSIRLQYVELSRRAVESRSIEVET